MNTRKIILALVIALAAAGSIVSGLQFARQEQQRRALAARKQALWQDVAHMLGRQAQMFDGDVAIVFKDLGGGFEFDYRGRALFPAASLVKIPIMCACFQAAHEGRLDLEDTVVLSSRVKTGGSGVLKSMPDGTVLTVRRLIEIMITESDNTASNLLIDKLGFEYLNRFFKASGLKHTNLSRRMMDFQSRKRGIENFTSASDIAILLEAIYRRRFIDRRTSELCLSLLLQQKVNDRIPARLPQDALVAHKTGLERRVCHDAGIVFIPSGSHVLICVLTKSKLGTSKVKKFIADIALEIYTKYQRFS